jgi:dihydrofolate reductase
VTRRLIITEDITPYGVVEIDGTWFAPTDNDEQGRELAGVTQEHAAASDGFLVGRITFEEMQEFWPGQVDDRTGVTDHLDRVGKYVVSRSLEDPDWEGTTVLRGGDDLAGQIRELTTLLDLTLAENRAFSGGVVLLRYTR